MYMRGGFMQVLLKLPVNHHIRGIYDEIRRDKDR